MDTEFDRIEREITIDAPTERVWALVAEPGWYINDDRMVEHEVRRDGDVSYVTDPKYGTFAFRTVELDEPNYAAFRWHIDTENLESSSTLVEFWLTPTESGVLLKVAESGFASLDEPEADRRSRFDDHFVGWPQELEIARKHLTGVAAGA
ncbi:SRPBCC domain-containing protein [Gordonia sp. PKS22-38]|uniref:SRPBCC domain-containing protein n=1 Tax=Gordonia prachuapensis TaxID=3115651 RepID=A0ABU7MUA5_9ACTN|nr:SRPBCC domain-containing protein [Gordonia sp. PKS22-38]